MYSLRFSGGLLVNNCKQTISRDLKQHKTLLTTVFIALLIVTCKSSSQNDCITAKQKTKNQ